MRPLADSMRGVVLRTAALALLVLSVASVSAQPPHAIVAKTVTVGSEVAALSLDLRDGSTLAIELTGGRVMVDGREVGSYDPLGPLDEAWRALLGTAVAVDGEALATALVEWSAPDGLEPAAARAAEQIHAALERVGNLEAVPATTPTDPAAELRSLLTLPDPSGTLAGLSEALRGVAVDELDVTVGSDRTVADGDVVGGGLLVVGGTLRVAGQVRGNVIVVGGELELADDGRIDGDVRLVGSDLVGDEAGIGGNLARITPGTAERDEARDQLRDEVRAQVESEMRAATAARGSQRRSPSALTRAIGGIGGVVGHLLSVVVLALIGGVVTHFAGPNLDAVAETARRTPARALVVGTAGAFLILPAFALGSLILAISIIGIPALLLWVPLFPVVIILAGGLGYLAVFRNVGVWVSRQRLPYLGWVQLSHPATLVAGGALAITLPSIGADLVSVLPWTGALETVLRASAFVLASVVGLLGFGAVLLTRAGRKPEFFDDDLFGGWSPRPPSRPTPPPAGGADTASAPPQTPAAEPAPPAPEPPVSEPSAHEPPAPEPSVQETPTEPAPGAEVTDPAADDGPDGSAPRGGGG